MFSVTDNVHSSSPALRRRLAAAVTIAFGVAAPVATATAAEPGSEKNLADMVAAYQTAHPQLSGAAARSAAAGSDARRALYEAAARDHETFAGAWFDPRTNVVHVAGTTDAANADAAALGRRYGLAVKPHRVARSAAELEQQAAALRSGKGELGEAARGQVGIDVRTNQVVAAVPPSRQAALQAKAGAGVKVVAGSNGAVEADLACTSRVNCDTSLRAGLELWRTQSSYRIPWCSLGFTARDASNTRWVYTAGHCTTGNNVIWGTGGTPIGPMVASANVGTADIAIIKVTEPWFAGDTTGRIYIQQSSPAWAAVDAVATQPALIIPGEVACLAANVTQPSAPNRCGIIGSSSDSNRRGMPRVDDVDACNGDSGGGWYWKLASGQRVAIGIHSASDKGCNGDQGGSASSFTSMATVKQFTPSLNVELG